MLFLGDIREKRENFFREIMDKNIKELLDTGKCFYISEDAQW